MKITIGSTTYDDIRNLSFAPEADVTGVTAPINCLSADIYTTQSIGNGGTLYLKDDRDNLWAQFWVTKAGRKNAQVVRVEARSLLWVLDATPMEAVMYSGTSVSTIMASLFSCIGGQYSLDSSLASLTVSGFCPEQTARERLQWVCFVIGAYINSCFNSVVQILPLDDTAGMIPLKKTYWRPEIGYRDYVTAVRVKSYTFTSGTPATTDKWVTDGTNTWIVTEQWLSLTNQDAPVSAQPNVVSVEDVTIIGSANVSTVLTRLAQYYFNRVTVDADIINNAEFLPGQLVQIHTDESSIYEGYLASADFSFGVQAKSKIHIIAATGQNTGTLIILYLFNGFQVSREVYVLPVGTAYEIETRYIDYTLSPHRYILRPEADTVAGTMTSGTVTETVQTTEALDLDYTDMVLTVISVDELEEDDGVVVIT